MSNRERRLLHVANGTCTTQLIEASGLPGLCSIWADPLDDGPVPGTLDDESLIDLRARVIEPGDPPAVRAALREWRRAIADTGSYDELVLWYEHDLFDQLNLIQLLDFVGRRIATHPVSLVSTDAFPGHPGFKGLGELTPVELRSLFAGRVAVGQTQYAHAARAWKAFTNDSPEDLVALAEGTDSALPFLTRALRRWLEEYPWTSDGLSRSERRLLRLARQAPIGLHELLPRMHEGEDAYFISDLSLVRLAGGLARQPSPLIEWYEGAPRRTPFDRALMATAYGCAVLDGRADRTTMGASNRWMGGVALDAGGKDWRWNAERGRLERRAPGSTRRQSER